MGAIYMEKSYPLEIEKAKKDGLPFIIPIGTIEYHSTHCPYGCDGLVSLGLAERIAKKIDAVIYPPVWYGVASYAVAGPEKNSINVDADTFENYIYCILKSLFLSGINKNIYLIIAHQTEDYMPMTLACMKAAKKLIMADLEEKGGYGWWGKRENKDFYENLSEKDSPWNKIRVIRFPDEKFRKTFGADHAGLYECSYLECLYPGSIKLERLKDSNDWFAESAKVLDLKTATIALNDAIDDLVKIMK